MARKSRRIDVFFSRRAERDLLLIWAWNAEIFGELRADEYIAFLRTEISKIAESRRSGSPVDGYPEILRAALRWKSSGHFHYAFYRKESDKIIVVRILHSAQNWPEILEGES